MREEKVELQGIQTRAGPVHLPLSSSAGAVLETLPGPEGPAAGDSDAIARFSTAGVQERESGRVERERDEETKVGGVESRKEGRKRRGLQCCFAGEPRKQN